MVWTILYHDAFLPEMEALPETVQDGVLVMAELLALSGPTLGRPHADTLAGSKFARNFGSRRTTGSGAWRSPSIPNAAP